MNTIVYPMPSMLQYKFCAEITWEDVMDKLNQELQTGSAKCMRHTYYLGNSYRPNTIQRAFDEVIGNSPLTLGDNEMHLFISFTPSAQVFGKHRDNDDVFLVQAIGKMIYELDREYVLSPGDSLFVPMGTYHTPKVIEPRVTLSFA